MSYVNRVLLPDEHVLHYARVTPALYMPGVIVITLAVLAAIYLPGIDERFRVLYDFTQTFRGNFFVFHAADITSYSLFAIGAAFMIHAVIVSSFTELAVTDRRVIAKKGVYQTVTTEIDRRKIAGVVIHQNMSGKMFNYGKVLLRGYSGDISHLPPIASPYEFQKVVNARF